MRPKTRTWRKEVPLYGLGLLVLLGVLASCGGGSMGPRQLIGISVQPVSGQAIAPDGTVPFSATGTNLPVQWASSDSTIATIDPNTGIATCLVVGGPITVTASAAGRGGTIHGSSTLACQLSPDPVVKLDPPFLDLSCTFHFGHCDCSNAGGTATLTNVGGATLAITSIVIDKHLIFSQSNNCGASVDSGQSCSIAVGFHPSSLDKVFAEVDITDNAAGSPQILALSGQTDCIP